jgi:hypothetical protein
MKTSFIIPKTLFTLLAFALVYMTGNAQIHVATDGDVGVGTTSPSGKLHVVLNSTSASYTGYLQNNRNDASTKYGLYNNVSSAGTGSRYGMFNYTYNSSANNSSTYGAYNYTLGSTGFTRGVYNYTYQPTGATSTGYGTYNYLNSYTSGTGYGLYNYSYTSSSATGSRYGLYNICNNYGSGSTTYALYSSVNTGTGTRYAGYFNGDVHVQGNLTWTSDERTKENINNLEGALALIDKLQPKTYNFKAEMDMNLPKGEQFGFVAQELETALPGLVKTIEHPVEAGELAIEPLSEEAVANGEVQEPTEAEATQGQQLKTVNYVALIPILVQAIKEQQQEIDALKQQLNDK